MGHWSSGEDAGFSSRRATVRVRHALLVIAWPSGKAAGCNPVHAGSIPAAVSSYNGRPGRRACLGGVATFATVAQWQSSGFQTRVVEGPIPSCRAGLPADLERRFGYAAEWDRPHRAVNPDPESVVGSIPTVPTDATGRAGGGRFREVAQLGARRHRKPEVAGSSPVFPTGGRVARLGRASVSYSEGSGFEPRPDLSRAISSTEEHESYKLRTEVRLLYCPPVGP